jgi:predicted Zn-dependent protease
MDQKTRSLWLAFASLACLLAVTLSAADTESAERGEYGRVDLTVKDIHLIETSEEMYGQFERRGLLHSDPELQTWLQEIGARLAPEPTDFYQKYRFNLIHDPSPNAFALPDGQIYVHTGLVSRLQNEAQLASLLAHEINHVAGHHGVLAYRSQRKKAAAGIFFSIAGAAVGGLGEVAGLMVNVGLVSSVYGYSRELEQEADVKGFELMLQAGYDVRQMPGLFEILSQDFEGLNPRIGGKWSTHPDLTLRGQYTAELAAGTAEETLAGLSLGNDDFRSRVRPVALETVRDYILADYPKTALELARDLVTESPDAADGYVATGHSYIALGARSEFAADAQLTDKEKKQQVKIRSRLTRDELRAQAEQSPEARSIIEHNLAAAEAAYKSALGLDQNAAEAHAGLGEIYLRRGQDRDSARELMTYLKKRPDAPDRSIVMEDLRDIAQRLTADTPGETQAEAKAPTETGE